MPSPAPKSDLIRYALLYHHGGLYMDADFVAVKVVNQQLCGKIQVEDFNHVQNAVE